LGKVFIHWRLPFATIDPRWYALDAVSKKQLIAFSLAQEEEIQQVTIDKIRCEDRLERN
jgi:hypothetical protein